MTSLTYLRVILDYKLDFSEQTKGLQQGEQGFSCFKVGLTLEVFGFASY